MLLRKQYVNKLFEFTHFRDLSAFEVLCYYINGHMQFLLHAMKTTRELQPRVRPCANDQHDHLNNYAEENQIEKQ